MARIVARILYLHRDPSFAGFIKDDLEILASRHEVQDVRTEANPQAAARLARALAWADLIYAWWGDLTGIVGLSAATLRRKPSILITGGYDVADVPSIRYGLRYHPWKKHLPPIALRLATQIVANSENGKREVVENYGIPPARVETVFHGFHADAYDPKRVPKERRVLTVSLISEPYVPYKGLGTYVEAARLLPDVPFVHVGKAAPDGAFERLRREAPPNVTFLGFLEDERLRDELCRATVYVQISAHEGFGMALAEAMLSGASPVVTDRGAIPEVAGEVARYVPYGDASATARAIREALDAPRGEAARARMVERFPMSRRRDAILAIVERLLAR